LTLTARLAYAMAETLVQVMFISDTQMFDKEQVQNFIFEILDEIGGCSLV